jgi:hypothetical protein
MSFEKKRQGNGIALSDELLIGLENPDPRGLDQLLDRLGQAP